MKKNILILTFVSVFCVNIFAQKNDTYLLGVDTVSFIDTVTINKDFTFAFNFTLLEFPSIKDKSLLDSIYKSALDTVMLDYSRAALRSIIEEQVNNAIAYAKENMPDGKSEYHLQNSMKIVSLTDNLLTLHYGKDSYQGGAYGWFSDCYKTFDLQRNKSILNTDIFKDVNDKSFSKILLEHFRKTYGEQIQTNCLLSDTIPISNSFYFNKESITFYYEVYEIVSYACNQRGTMITVPFVDIYEYLKPEFVETYLQESKDNNRKNKK